MSGQGLSEMQAHVVLYRKATLVIRDNISMEDVYLTRRLSA